MLVKEESTATIVIRFVLVVDALFIMLLKGEKQYKHKDDVVVFVSFLSTELLLMFMCCLIR